MGDYSELIKNFEKTRLYIRDLFIYGYKVKGDFTKKAGRTYDDEKRRVESWLDGHLRYENTSRGKQVSISADSSRLKENPLYRAYYAKSFTDNDIRLHFMISDILGDRKQRSLKELIDETDRRFGILFDEQTVRNKLKEYTEEGLILSEKHGKTAYFSLSTYRTEELFRCLPGLSDAVTFFSEENVFGVVGNSIMKAASLENTLFSIKHNYIVHTMETALLTDVIAAIEQKRYISLRAFTAKNDFSHESVHLLLPMQISVSRCTGRRYVIGYIPKSRRFFSMRLDLVSRGEIGEICPQYDEIYEKYRKNILRCFGSSFGDRQERGKITPLRAVISYNEERESYILGRLLREKRIGTLEKPGSGLYRLTIDSFDPAEPMHFIKSFIGRILSVEGGCASVRRLFRSDVQRMYKMYVGNELPPAADKPQFNEPPCTASDDTATQHIQIEISAPTEQDEPITPKPNIFSEIYGAYFRTAAALLEIRDRPLTEKDFYRAVEIHGFRDSALFLPKKLIPQKDSSDWGLFRRETGGIFPVTAAPAPNILSALQLSWLKAILFDEKMPLFLDNTQLTALSEKLKNIAPLYRQDHFRFFDKFTDGDNYGSEEYRRNFKAALSALKAHQLLKISYKSKTGQPKQNTVLPLKLEYSPKNDKFRLLCRRQCGDKLCGSVILNIGRIVSAAPMDIYFDGSAVNKMMSRFFKGRRAELPVTVKVYPERNAPERFLMEFAPFEKQVARDPVSGALTVKIYFDRDDETELLIMLLSFGAAVEILSPPSFRKQAAGRVRRQAEILYIEE